MLTNPHNLHEGGSVSSSSIYCEVPFISSFVRGVKVRLFKFTVSFIVGEEFQLSVVC